MAGPRYQLHQDLLAFAVELGRQNADAGYMPPGCASEGIRPSAAMSSLTLRIGIVRVAARTAAVICLPPQLITSGADCTSSATEGAVCSGRDPGFRQSMVRFLPSTNPALSSSSKNAAHCGA